MKLLQRIIEGTVNALIAILAVICAFFVTLFGKEMNARDSIARDNDASMRRYRCSKIR